MTAVLGHPSRWRCCVILPKQKQKKPPELEKNVVTCAVVKQRHVCTSSLWLSLKANILFLFFFVFVSFGGSAFVLDGDPEPTMKLRVQNDR